MSLFGSTQSKPSLFVTPPPSGGNQSNTGSLFGQQAQPQTQQGSSLFGQPLQQPSTSLFGQPQQQQQQPSTSLFGQPQQQQAQQPSNSLFGNTNSIQQQQPPSSSLFQQPQQQQNNSLLGGSQQQSGSRSLWQPGQMPQPREKSIPEQMQTLLEKWSPESPSCLFQQYFYNTVRPEAVPYYGPGPGEDEAKWEEALSNKPSEDAIPVVCKGFAALGNRLRIQVQAVTALQARLHEVNNSLTAILQTHDLDITVRTNDAKRRHLVLNQRCLQLATKIQVLKSRGYALDGAEEGLRTKLQDLERDTFDPRFDGRQEEIWARMVDIRDRARYLKEETEKTGRSLADTNGEALDQDVMKKTKKILSDYDAQIAHLNREMDSMKRDFEAWEAG